MERTIQLRFGFKDDIRCHRVIESWVARNSLDEDNQSRKTAVQKSYGTCIRHNRDFGQPSTGTSGNQHVIYKSVGTPGMTGSLLNCKL